MCIDLTVDKYIQGQGCLCYFTDTENEDQTVWECLSSQRSGAFGMNFFLHLHVVPLDRGREEGARLVPQQGPWACVRLPVLD